MGNHSTPSPRSERVSSALPVTAFLAFMFVLAVIAWILVWYAFIR